VANNQYAAGWDDNLDEELADEQEEEELGTYTERV
jgi:hypothetical protein